MKFKSIKPFVSEFITMLMVIGTMVFFSFELGDIKIYVNYKDIVVFLSFVFVGVWFLYVFVRVINMGFKVLVDYFWQKLIEDQYTLLNISPYQASIFSNGTKKYDVKMYYLINCKKDDGRIYTFISSEYVDVTEGKEYIFKTGKFSGVLVSYTEKS